MSVPGESVTGWGCCYLAVPPLSAPLAGNTRNLLLSAPGFSQELPVCQLCGKRERRGENLEGLGFHKFNFLTLRASKYGSESPVVQKNVLLCDLSLYPECVIGEGLLFELINYSPTVFNLPFFRISSNSTCQFIISIF